MTISDHDNFRGNKLLQDVQLPVEILSRNFQEILRIFKNSNRIAQVVNKDFRL